VWLDIQKKIFATEINQNDQNAVVLSGPLSEPKSFSETVLWHMDAYGSNLELSSSPMGHSILKEGLFTGLEPRYWLVVCHLPCQNSLPNEITSSDIGG